MSDSRFKPALKSLVAELPFIVEAWESIHPANGEIPGGYRLDRLEAMLPSWIAAASKARQQSSPQDTRRILLLGSLSWWVEYGTLLGLWLSGKGHEAELAILPYRRWTESVSAFDARRQRAYLRRVLASAKHLLRTHDILGMPAEDLPDELLQSMAAQSRVDVQYTMRRETVHLETPGEDRRLYELRLVRNLAAARRLYAWLKLHPYQVVVLPNGSILEFGAAYRVARYLGVPVVTFEFGEQRQRMWLAQNSEVMLQDTQALWDALGDQELTEQETSALLKMREARRGGVLWSNFTRKWQTHEGQGAQAARKALGLDPARPVVLLCTNVVGDSLSLGRQLFTEGMADWLMRTVRFFADRPDVQLVVRVHPGELRGVGHPSEKIIEAALPEMPPHVVVVPPAAKINTYDLIELTHLGLVYTTTVGLEMAMSGVPVIVAGRTHYRGKGFTIDPRSFEEYETMLSRLLERPASQGLDREQITLAERYAYRFFFNYAFPSPWHLRYFWEDVEARPLETCLSLDGRQQYDRTLSALIGDELSWTVGEGT